MSSSKAWGYPRGSGKYPAPSSFNTSPATTPPRFTAEGQPVLNPNSCDGTCEETWRELYRKAIFEEDPLTQPAQVEAAEAAIRDRVLELCRTDTGEGRDARERVELHCALYFVGILRSLQAGSVSQDVATRLM